jgi:aspartokinase-like uncharacterized kinase
MLTTMKADLRIALSDVESHWFAIDCIAQPSEVD